MSGGKIAMIVIGAVLALIGLIALLAGGTLLWVNFSQRDASGFYTTPTAHLDTSTHAFTSDVDLGAPTSQGNWVPVHVLGTVRIRATAVSGQPIFIGIGPRTAVNRWLSGVSHAHVREVGFSPFRLDTQPVRGTAEPSPPTSQTFWVASVSGSGAQTLRWATRGGDWSAVIMNANGSSGINVDVTVGANTGILLPIGIGATVFGVVVLGAAALLIVLGARRDKDTAPNQPPPPSVPVQPGQYVTSGPPPPPF